MSRITSAGLGSQAREVPIRHVAFPFDTERMATYCWRDDAFSSAFILTFSAFIPHGERLVIEAVRAYRDQLSDPELAARVAGLIGQEAMHSRVHEEFNAAYLAKGLPMDRVDAAGRWFFTRLLPDVLSPEMQLAVTCAIEHFTALMAERSFREPELSEHLDPAARAFLLWHLLEECEHKSVAIDVYRATVDDERLRALAMVFILASSSMIFAYSMAVLLRTPGFAQGPLAEARGFLYWFGPRGYFARMQRGLGRYYRRDFHPDQIDTDAMLETWRERLFGAEGQLTPYVRKTLHPGRR